MRNVFLIGMPSSGKSTLGRRLAKALEYRFVDLDHLIESDQQMSISDIFARLGEAHFRETESRILQSLLSDQGLLVATGGGAPCSGNEPAVLTSRSLNPDRERWLTARPHRRPAASTFPMAAAVRGLSGPA